MSDTVDLASLPTPEHLTLLFKYGKSTTLLSVLPTQPFSEIKEMLLAALKARNIFTLPGTDIDLPEDASDIQLGVLQDRKDSSKGWKPLVIKEQQHANSKAGKKKAGARSDTTSDSPAGAGLVDGSWLAYRLGTQPDEEEDDPMTGEQAADWNVILPSYDDEEIET